MNELFNFSSPKGKEKEYIDPIIQKIHSLRVEIKKIITASYYDVERSILLKGERRNNLAILADALIYVAAKNSNSIEEIDMRTNPVLNHLFNRKDLLNFLNNACQDHSAITMQKTVNTIVKEFKLPYQDFYDLEKILEQKSLESKPYIKAALQMYLLKGHFNWYDISMSSFRSFLRDETKTSLDDNATINCWDAIFYVLLKSNIIPRKYLIELYSRGIEEAQSTLISWLKSAHENTPDSEKQDDLWHENLSKKPYFIGSGSNVSNMGIQHDMISFPYSQKQLLKMLITQNFNEEPSKAKVYSIWEKWNKGKVGSVKLSNFAEWLKIPGKKLYFIPLDMLLQRAKELFEPRTKKQHFPEINFSRGSNPISKLKKHFKTSKNNYS